eukprot:5963103-Pyramimonas_sp.AAC.1
MDRTDDSSANGSDGRIARGGRGYASWFGDDGGAADRLARGNAPYGNTFDHDAPLFEGRERTWCMG